MSPYDEGVDLKEISAKLNLLNQKDLHSLVKEYDEENNPEGTLTLAYILLTYGVKLDDWFQLLVMRACKDDGWAKNNPTRKKYVDELLNAVQSNDGSNLSQDEGLLAAFAAEENKGKKVINKIKIK